MVWGEDDMWSVELEIAPGSYDFKCVVVREDGSIAEWEPGDNRALEVPESDSQNVMEVFCQWSDTSATFMSFDEDDIAARLEASRKKEAEAVSETPGGVNPAAESQSGEEGTGLAKLDAGALEDNTPIEDKIEAVASAMESGKEDGTEGALANKGLTHSKEDPKEEIVEGLAKLDADAPQEGNRPIEQKIDEVAAAMQQDEHEKEAVDDSVPTEGSDGKSPQTASSSTSMAGQSPGGGGSQGPGALSAIARESQPTPEVQAIAVALGLLAIPVVGWSEYTLKTTGCGLPPGPSGLLGAAEGISYVVVLGMAAWAFVKKVTSGKGLPAGPAGLLGAVEGLSYAAIVAGVAVLGLQLRDYGYIPAALPDSNCFGGGSRNAALEKPAAGSRALQEVVSKVKVAPSRGKLNHQTTSQQLPLATIGFPLATMEDKVKDKSLQGQVASGVQSLARGAKEEAQPRPKSAADLDFLKEDLSKLWSFLAGNRGARAAEMKLQETSSASETASSMPNMPEPIKSAVEGVQRNLTGPQLTMEELSSGAEDGLSSADLAPVVEELDEALSSIGRFFNGIKEKVTSSKPVVAHQANLVPTASGTLPLGQPRELIARAAADRLQRNATFKLAAASLDLRSAWSDFERPAPSQMPLRWVGMDLGISMAATNAVTAANNVTQNLNTAVMQLQSTVDGVKSVVQEVSEAGIKEGLDLSELFASINDLEGTLLRAKENTSLKADLIPVAEQLETAAKALRSNGDGSVKTAERFEKAAASVREAASGFDVDAIDAATSKVSETVEALPKSNGKALEAPKETVEPIIANVGKVKGLLESALEALEPVQQAENGLPGELGTTGAGQEQSSAELGKLDSSFGLSALDESIAGVGEQ